MSDGRTSHSELPLVIKEALQNYMTRTVTEKQLPITREYYKDYAAIFYAPGGGLEVELYANEQPYCLLDKNKKKQAIGVYMMVDCTDRVHELRPHEKGFQGNDFEDIYEAQCTLVQELVEGLVKALKVENNSSSLLMTRCDRKTLIVHATPQAMVCIQAGMHDRVPQRSRNKEYYMNCGVSICRRLNADVTDEDVDDLFKENKKEWKVQKDSDYRDYAMHMMAFMMGFHPRLGNSSILNAMDADVVRDKIAPLVLQESFKLLAAADAKLMLSWPQLQN